MIKFSVTWTGSPDTLIAHFAELPGVVMANVATKVQQLTGELEAQVRSNVTSGHPLYSKTGALLSSIGQTFEADALSAIGSVYSKGVEYAHIQEYGGATPPHEIDPVEATALRFLSKRSIGFRTGAVSGEVVFAQHVDHPGARMPERSFLRRSLAEMRVDIGTQIKQAALDALKREGYPI
jgi:hypothetical protein